MNSADYITGIFSYRLYKQKTSQPKLQRDRLLAKLDPTMRVCPLCRYPFQQTLSLSWFYEQARNWVKSEFARKVFPHDLVNITLRVVELLPTKHNDVLGQDDIEWAKDLCADCILTYHKHWIKRDSKAIDNLHMLMDVDFDPLSIYSPEDEARKYMKAKFKEAKELVKNSANV